VPPIATITPHILEPLLELDLKIGYFHTWRESPSLAVLSPVSLSTSCNSNKRPRRAYPRTYRSHRVHDGGARAPTKRTSGMTRVSENCAMVVELYCFNSHSAAVEDRRENGRKGAAGTETVADYRSALDFRFSCKAPSLPALAIGQ